MNVPLLRDSSNVDPITVTVRLAILALSIAVFKAVSISLASRNPVVSASLPAVSPALVLTVYVAADAPDGCIVTEYSALYSTRCILTVPTCPSAVSYTNLTLPTILLV